MTEQTATPPENQPADDTTKIRTVVAEVLGSLLGSGKAAVADEPPAKSATATRKERDESVSETVKKAIRDVNSERAQAESLTALAKDVSDLKAATQKPPKAIRKVEKFMGWHVDEED